MIKDNKGFTIIEVLMAIFIMSVGLIGIYALIPMIVSTTSMNINKFIASELAKEGIEIVRNTRDSNWLSGDEWTQSLSGCAAGCEVDYDDAFPTSWQDRYLKVSSNGFYNYEDGIETKFKRRITIIQNADTLTVQAEISWPDKYSPLIVNEKLYNWR